MKILFINGSSGSSGASHSLLTLIKILRDNFSVDSTVIIPEYGPFVERLKSENISYHIINNLSWCIDVKRERKIEVLKGSIKKLLNTIPENKLDRLIKKEKFDIVHINALTTGFGADVAIRNDVGLVWHLREYLDLDINTRFINSKYSEKLINQSDRIIAISDSIKKYHSNKFDIKKIVKIYNGIDQTNYISSSRKIMENDQIIITMVGRISKNKGQDEAIKAISKVIKDGYNIRFQIVGNDGDEEYIHYLKSLIKEENIENNVKYLGYQPNISKIWKSTDIGLVCSMHEAFGRVTIEAMMAGALVIGANTAGTAELIDNNNYGMLYEQGNYRNLAEVIKFAIKNKEESKVISNRARKHSLENFTADRNAEKIYQTYLDILKEKSRKNKR